MAKDKVIEGGTAEIGYTIQPVTNGNLLLMALRGYWTADLAKKYQDDIRALWTTGYQVRGAVVDVRASPIQSTEVAALRSQIIGEAIARGLGALAYVSTSTLAKMQMRRISIEGGCRDVECFDDPPAARAWVDRILAKGGISTT